VAIVTQLKALGRFGGAIRELADIAGRPRKMLHELVGIGLPIWDPPEPRPPSPPDQAAVDRAQEVIRMATEDERRALTKVLETARKVRQGEPRQEPKGRPPAPPPPGPRPRQDVTQRPPGSS